MKPAFLRITFYVLFVIFLLAPSPGNAVLAQESTPSDDQVNAIAKQLYCPVCENTPLDVCPTEACRQWRALIREQLADGWSEAQIKQYFVDNYGARVLAEPPGTGINRLFYLLPPAIILAAALLLWRGLRTWTRSSAAAARAGSSGEESSPDEYVAKMERELRNRS